jgi:phosphatidylserine/phosphatidylglycerophosphate/cardiolipin synthase-like enzyme
LATLTGGKYSLDVVRSAIPLRPEVDERRRARLKLVFGAAHYSELLCELPKAKVAVWIATANLKDVRLEAPIGSRARARGRYWSALELFGDLIQRGVDVRVLHGRPPSAPFQRELRGRAGLKKKLELRHCPRVHMKVVCVDGRLLYLGSANFTGAGMGARDAARRNFELGVVTDDEYLLDQAQAEFAAIWSGRHCARCKLRRLCPKPIDTL